MGCMLQVTGRDPVGIKVRASKGLNAIDYFLPGYHVWNNMIEALADFGYDPDSMVSYNPPSPLLRPSPSPQHPTPASAALRNHGMCNTHTIAVPPMAILDCLSLPAVGGDV